MLSYRFFDMLMEHSQMCKPIRNIIFDLGNVIINIDPNLTLQKFREAGVVNFSDMYTIMRQTDVFDRLDTGKITIPEFRQVVRDFSNLDLTDELIDDAWCAMLLDFPEENVELLRKLSTEGYKLFLLSNTNELHINFYKKYMFKRFGCDLLEELFNRTYYSHEIGLRKPNSDVYEYVLKSENLDPSETLFIDDLEHNVIGARQTGIKAYHYKIS